MFADHQGELVPEGVDAIGHVSARREASVTVAGSGDGRCRLSAVGAFDLSNRDALVTAIRAASAGRFDVIEVDLREVGFIDAGVVRVLLEARAELSDLGCTLRVVGATGLPAMVLQLTSAYADLC